MHELSSNQPRLGALDPNDMYRALVEQLPAIAYLVRVHPSARTGTASPTIYISPQVQDILGFTREEWLADPTLWIKQLHPQDKDRMLVAVEESNRQKSDFKLEYRAARKDGRYINLYNTARHLRGTDGAYYTEGLMFDISPRKRQALRDAVLAHCAEQLHSESDLPAMGHWLRAQLDEVMPATNLMLALKDESSGWLSFPVYFDEVDPPAKPRPPARSLIDYVLATNHSFHWQRPGDREAFEKADYHILGTASADWIGAPIPGAREPMGVIALQIYSGSASYIEEDVSLLESIASALGRALRELQNAEDMRRRLVHDELLTSISTDALDASDVNAFLTASIERLGHSLQVSRSYLFEHLHETDVMRNTIEWCAPGIAPQKDTLQNLPAHPFHWYLSQLKRGQPVAFKNVKDIPDQTTREELLRQSIVSQIAVPLFVDGIYYGFIGFDDCYANRVWPESDLPVIIAIARILTHVIERERFRAKQAEQIDELQRWHDITMGREKRVLELKQEVNELLQSMDKEPRYPTE